MNDGAYVYNFFYVQNIYDLEMVNTKASGIVVFSTKTNPAI